MLAGAADPIPARPDPLARLRVLGLALPEVTEIKTKCRLRDVIGHVALFCRLSPCPDGSSEGVDAQERWSRKYTAGHWPAVPVEAFADAGISAARDDRYTPTAPSE